MQPIVRSMVTTPRSQRHEAAGAASGVCSSTRRMAIRTITSARRSQQRRRPSSPQGTIGMTTRRRRRRSRGRREGRTRRLRMISRRRHGEPAASPQGRARCARSECCVHFIVIVGRLARVVPVCVRLQPTKRRVLATAPQVRWRPRPWWTVAPRAAAARPTAGACHRSHHHLNRSIHTRYTSAILLYSARVAWVSFVTAADGGTIHRTRRRAAACHCRLARAS